MAADCDQGGICTWQPEGFRIRLACTRDDLVNNYANPDVSGVPEVAQIPQAESWTKRRTVTEGTLKAFTGTCGQQRKVTNDRVRVAWDVLFEDCEKIPIEGAYFRQGECWWVEIVECRSGIGQRAFVLISFANNQVQDINGTENVTEIVTMDLQSQFELVGYDPACFPTLPVCAPPGTTQCPVIVNPCCPADGS